MDSIANRMKIAMSNLKISQAELVKRTGIGKSSISTYLTGEYEPKQKNLYKIALALNVNEAWLMGLDVPMEKSKQLNNMNEEQELLEKFNKLSNSQQKQLINYAEFLLQQQKDK